MNMKAIAGLVGFLVVAPIWYWLLYQVLARVNATELMWFLYWVYIPAAIFVGVLTKLTDAKPSKV
jgi:hypothetical protein